MAKKLYVGNLPFSCTDAELSQTFIQFGTVTSARVITDRETGRSKGFGFIEMEVDSEALRAVQELDGKELNGRRLTVNEARPRDANGGGGGGGGGGGRRDNGGRSSSRRGYDART